MYAQSLPPAGGVLFTGTIALTGGGPWALVPGALVCVGAGLLLIRHQRAREWRLQQAETENAAITA